jgi:hypothetical protein
MTDTDHFRRFERVSSVMETEHGLQAEVHDEKLRLDVVRPDVVRIAISRGASSTRSRRMPSASTRWQSTPRSSSTATPTSSDCARPRFL